MIQLSNMFDMLGQNGCIDVATSLAMQGADTSISIPIYDIFFLKILPGEMSSYIAGSINEYNAIRQLAENCGAVAIELNMLDIDILGLIGALVIATPNTGMHIFTKLGSIIPDQLSEDIIDCMANDLGVPIPQCAFNIFGFAQELIQTAFDKIMYNIQVDMGECGIELHSWEELPGYYSMLRDTGEMFDMRQYREVNGHSII